MFSCPLGLWCEFFFSFVTKFLFYILFFVLCPRFPCLRTKQWLARGFKSRVSVRFYPLASHFSSNSLLTPHSSCPPNYCFLLLIEKPNSESPGTNPRVLFPPFSLPFLFPCLSLKAWERPEYWPGQGSTSHSRVKWPRSTESWSESPTV